MIFGFGLLPASVGVRNMELGGAVLSRIITSYRKSPPPPQDSTWAKLFKKAKLHFENFLIISVGSIG